MKTGGISLPEERLRNEMVYFGRPFGPHTIPEEVIILKQ